MRSFEDWYFDLFESGNGSSLNQQEIAEEAWDYRQTEVNDLQKQLDDVIQKSKEFIQFSKNNADIFEDEYEAGKAYGAEAVIELLEQALKGGGE